MSKMASMKMGMKNSAMKVSMKKSDKIVSKSRSNAPKKGKGAKNMPPLKPEKIRIQIY